jgi:hypothetical protein
MSSDGEKSYNDSQAEDKSQASTHDDFYIGDSSSEGSLPPSRTLDFQGCNIDSDYEEESSSDKEEEGSSSDKEESSSDKEGSSSDKEGSSSDKEEEGSSSDKEGSSSDKEGSSSDKEEEGSSSDKEEEGSSSDKEESSSDKENSSGQDDDPPKTPTPTKKKKKKKKKKASRKANTVEPSIAANNGSVSGASSDPQVSFPIPGFRVDLVMAQGRIPEFNGEDLPELMRKLNGTHESWKGTNLKFVYYFPTPESDPTQAGVAPPKLKMKPFPSKGKGVQATFCMVPFHHSSPALKVKGYSSGGRFHLAGGATVEQARSVLYELASILSIVLKKPLEIQEFATLMVNGIGSVERPIQLPMLHQKLTEGYPHLSTKYGGHPALMVYFYGQDGTCPPNLSVSKAKKARKQKVSRCTIMIQPTGVVQFKGSPDESQLNHAHQFVHKLVNAHADTFA